jgi:hypothetical protein
MITIDRAAERARLTALADRFIEALAAREPQRLPVAPDVRVTENCQQIALGTGIWRTCREVRPGGHHFVDVERGQVAWWGVVEELRGTGLLCVRLAVEGRLITEIEIVVSRGGQYDRPDAVLAEYPEMHAIIPAGDRASRGELVAAAHSYFDAINRVDGAGLPVSPDTVRIVNGFEDSAVDAAGLSDEEKYLALDVAEQITQGHYSYIERIRDERVTVIDEERGLCHCAVMFDHPGDLTRPNGVLLFGAPNTMVFFEVFKVTRAGIQQVWAIGASLPYGAKDGWS